MEQGICANCHGLSDDLDEEGLCSDCRRREHAKEEAILDRARQLKVERTSGCKFGRCDL